MSLKPSDTLSKRVLARNMRSKMRSEEYQQKRRKNQIYFWLTLTLLLGLPIVYWAGVEKQVWAQITSKSLNWYLELSWLVLAFAWVKNYERFREYQKRDDQLLKLEMELAIEDETETPNVA